MYAPPRVAMSARSIFNSSLPASSVKLTFTTPDDARAEGEIATRASGSEEAIGL